jgi:hypothetical protein
MLTLICAFATGAKGMVPNASNAVASNALFERNVLSPRIYDPLKVGSLKYTGVGSVGNAWDAVLP